MSLSSFFCRASKTLRSVSTACGAMSTSSSSKSGLPRPCTSASRRATRAALAARRSRTSPNSAANRVSSIFIRIWPCFTIAPSCTRISRTMPPSRLCRTWVCRDGTTRPLPRLTSSSSAKCAQVSPAAINARIDARRIRDVRGVPSSDAARTSLKNARSDGRIRFHRCGRLERRAPFDGLETRNDLVARSVRDNVSALEHKQAIHARQHRHPMRRDKNRHVALSQQLQAFDEFRFAAQIEVRRRLVKKQNPRLADDGTGESDCLLLPSRQAAAAFLDGEIVAKRVSGSELLDARQPRRFENLLLGRGRKTKRDIVTQPAEEQINILQNEPDAVAQVRGIVLAQINVIDQNAAFVRIVETGEQAADGRLAGSDLADKSQSGLEFSGVSLSRVASASTRAGALIISFSRTTAASIGCLVRSHPSLHRQRERQRLPGLIRSGRVLRHRIRWIC